MICKNCGTEIQAGAKFCTECGARLSSPIRVTPTPRDAHSVDDQFNQQPQQYRGKKKHRLLRWIVIIAIILLLFIYFSPETRELYVYSKMTIRSEETLTPQEKQEIDNLVDSRFSGTYLLHNEDGFFIADLQSGLGFSEKDWRDSIGDTSRMDFSSSGNYAYIEVSDLDSNDSFVLTYVRASFTERIYFLSRYYSWS